MEDDEATRRRRELELARARDRDRDRTFWDLIERCYLVLLIIVLDLFTKDEERNKRRRDKEADGRHSSKKQFRRIDIPDYEHCLWNHWEGSGPHDEEAWFEKVGLPEDSFAALVLVMLPFWIATPIVEAEGNVNQPRDSDLKRRQLNCRDTVALVLRWYTSTSKRVDVMQEFGQTKGNFDKYLKFGIRIMIEALKDHPTARIEWPCQDKEYLEKMADSIRLYALVVLERNVDMLIRIL
jgi:hypothetical protein